MADTEDTPADDAAEPVYFDPPAGTTHYVIMALGGEQAVALSIATERREIHSYALTQVDANNIVPRGIQADLIGELFAWVRDTFDEELPVLDRLIYARHCMYVVTNILKCARETLGDWSNDDAEALGLQRPVTVNHHLSASQNDVERAIIE